MPAIGKLARRVIVQRATTEQDEYGAPIETWGDLMTSWADRTDVSDGEKYAANTVLSTLLSRFIVRSTPATRGILPTDRLAHDGALWNIGGVKETRDGRRRFLEITALTGS